MNFPEFTTKITTKNHLLRQSYAHLCGVCIKCTVYKNKKALYLKDLKALKYKKHLI